MTRENTDRRRRLLLLILASCAVSVSTLDACGSPSPSPSSSGEPDYYALSSPDPKWEQTSRADLQAFLEAQRPRMEADAEGYKAAAAGFAALDALDVVVAAQQLKRGGELYAKSARLMAAMSPPPEFSDITRMAQTQARYAGTLLELGRYLDDFGWGDRFTKGQAARADALIAAFNRAGRPWDLAANDFWMQLHIAEQDRHLTHPEWMDRLTEDMRGFDSDATPSSVVL